ncbi:MAG: glycosyltransferase family 4 protein [Gammaproteobacteria bacterium]|nr:glycosyltransferase family 4 protein [Gammaproteobacteria bacterium]
MKILYICADYGIPVLGGKGAAVHVREMSNALVQTGCSVVIAAPMATSSPWDIPQDTEAEFIQFSANKNTVELIHAIKSYTENLGETSALSGEIRRIVYNEEFEGKLLRRFKKSPPDFIYVRASLYSTAGISLKKELGIPLIVEINAPLALEQHLYRSSETKKLAYAAERKLLSHADAILCVSKELKNYVASLDIDSNRIHVIPNGVNPQLFNIQEKNNALRDKTGLGQGPVLGFVGGLRPWHGVKILPELLNRIKAVHPDVQLLIVGEGPLKNSLACDFREKNLENNVIFTGNLPHKDIPGIINLFDIALAPYAKPEHDFYFSPLKLFEYMACGIPIVTTRIGQIQDIIQDNETGLLYEPGDVEQLTNHCLNILKNPGLARLLGFNAEKIAKERYTWDHNVKRVMSIKGAL